MNAATNAATNTLSNNTQKQRPHAGSSLANPKSDKGKTKTTEHLYKNVNFMDKNVNSSESSSSIVAVSTVSSLPESTPSNSQTYTTISTHIQKQPAPTKLSNIRSDKHVSLVFFFLLAF